MNTLIQWISCVKVASNFLFRLGVRPVGRMRTQVRLLNLLVRLAGWVNGKLVGSMRNAERMMLCSISSIHNVEMPSKMSYLLFISSPCQNRRMFLARIAECLEITVLARIAECLEIKIVSAVTWISLSIKFVVLRRRWKESPETLPCTARGIPRNYWQLIDKFIEDGFDSGVSVILLFLL